jgi:hypothetical protein
MDEPATACWSTVRLQSGSQWCEHSATGVSSRRSYAGGATYREEGGPPVDRVWWCGRAWLWVFEAWSTALEYQTRGIRHGPSPRARNQHNRVVVLVACAWSVIVSVCVALALLDSLWCAQSRTRPSLHWSRQPPPLGRPVRECGGRLLGAARSQSSSDLRRLTVTRLVARRSGDGRCGSDANRPTDPAQHRFWRLSCSGQTEEVAQAGPQ